MTEKQSEFEKAGSGQNAGILAEFLAMLKENKKYWLLPIAIGLLLVGVIVILGSTSAAPFIYSFW
jgi:hypothetical protein